MANSRLFPTRRDLSQADHRLLSDAYEVACDQLTDQNGYSTDQLSAGLDDVTSTLLRLFDAGIRDERQLGKRAARQIHDSLNRAKTRRLAYH